jgi:hypothetical protein
MFDSQRTNLQFRCGVLSEQFGGSLKGRVEIAKVGHPSGIGRLKKVDSISADMSLKKKETNRRFILFTSFMIC